MAKSTRKIVIIAAVIVLLIAGIVVLNVIDFESVEVETTATSEPMYTLYSKEVSEISAVSVHKGHAGNGGHTEECSIRASVDKDGLWTINGLDKSEFDQSKIYTLVSTASSISSKNKVAENVNDFEQYGLGLPSATVTVNDKKLGEATFEIGDKSPTLGEYFIRFLNGGNADHTTVYTLAAYKVDTLLQPISYYSDFNRFSINIDDITNIKIERTDETIELRIAEDIASTTNNVWEIVKPYESSANDEYIDNNILAAIEKLIFNSPVTNGAHGTDNPSAKITLTVKPYDNTTGKYGDEYTETFAVGDVESGRAYVEYKSKVYAVDASAVEFVNTKAFNALNKLQALVDISVVEKVEVTFGSASNDIEVVHDGDELSFRFNGAEADYKLTRSMYQAIISLAVDGVYNGEELGATLLELDFDGVKGSEDVKIEFKFINDLSCALVRNGKAEFTIKQNKISEFEKVWNEYIKEVIK